MGYTDGPLGCHGVYLFETPSLGQSYGSAVNRLGFRTRLFLFLALFAVVPATVLTLAWGAAVTRVLPLMAGNAAWDTVSATGDRALEVARHGARTAADSARIAEHQQALANSITMSRRFELLSARAPAALVFASLLLLACLTFIAARVAGHLSRQFSRPLHELVSWTDMIARGDALPPAAARGAPEFGVLRSGMQQMATDLEAGRRAALEAGRLAAFRESARQVAHELKNPLTPIRFAVSRLRGKVAPELAETVEVLATESARLEQMAKSFAQFGRLPDGPVAEVDIGELIANAVRVSVPDEFPCDVLIDPTLPPLMGQHDALGRALGNVLLNAVEACGPRGRLSIHVAAVPDGMAIVVSDDGPGVEESKLATIWDPYVTHKAGGTGLGLAIVRQTIEAHGGRVHAKSAPSHGMEITLTLPAASARAEENR